MDRIYAGSNIRIEVQPDRWVLLLNSDAGDTVLAEASAGQPLRYVSAFGAQRRLPVGGQLPTHDIDRVVLGWSAKDEAWHLGLMLTSALAQARSSRWCELAHWPDPTTTQYEELAVQAGRVLAQQIARPFTLIPREGVEGGANGANATAADPRGAYPASGYAAVPAAPPAPLPALPLKLDLWTLAALGRSRENGASASGGLELRLAGAWGRSRLIRAAWYIFWIGVFIVLSITTLISPIAQPRPEFLPYLGFACAAGLTLVVLYNLISAGTRLNRVVVTPSERAIAGGRGRGVGAGRGERWRYGREDLQGVYVSHVVTKVNRRRKRPPMRAVQYGELNLLLQNGKFVHLLAQGGLDDKYPVLDPLPAEGERADSANDDAIKMLTPYEVQTSLQAAALMIANALDLPCYLDRRVR
ncbi:MAG: hypothetical protein SGI73_21690 [Chloroflexota bacterium]|nr:hypothetical protein [Chloroflexota bacterium]